MLSNLLMNLCTAVEANYLQLWSDSAELLPPHQIAMSPLLRKVRLLRIGTIAGTSLGWLDRLDMGR